MKKSPLFIYFCDMLGKAIPLDLSNSGPRRMETSFLLRRGLSLSHLCFVNDLFLFAKAYLDKVVIIKPCLDSFASTLDKR